MSPAPSAGDPLVQRVTVSCFTVPTDAPESDGTLTWESTTIVVVEVTGGDTAGLGYTYAHPAAGLLIQSTLAEVVTGRSALAVPAAWQAMVHEVRNLGRPGLCSMAIAAVDSALWDLKARLLGLPLVTLLGQMRQAVPLYGSGGFTSYDEQRLRDQLGSWASDGFSMVKMKVGRDPAADPARVRSAREAIGPSTALFVDANGAYRRKQALELAMHFAESWGELVRGAGVLR